MLNSSQKKKLTFIFMILSTIFAAIQIIPIISDTFKDTLPPAPINTVSAPGGVAVVNNGINALPAGDNSPMQVTINNSDVNTLEYLKKEIIGHEQQAQTSRTLEEKLAAAEKSLKAWQFWYFQSAQPLAIEMLKDLAALQNYSVEKVKFISRWEKDIESIEARNFFIDNVILRYEWAQERNGLINITPLGLDLLKQSGITITPYTTKIANPSFNCLKAKEWFEHTICSDATLAKLDVEMANLFKALISDPDNNVQEIKASQVEWRNTIRNKCPNHQCLLTSYNDRVEQLSSMISHR
ncbi:TPA: lysozyme inhibitor LprI family protein [Aeromonas veronii]